MKLRTLVIIFILVLTVGLLFLFLTNRLTSKSAPVALDYSSVANTSSPTVLGEKAARPASTLNLESPAFSDNQPLPSRYTCSGIGINPPLEISGVPVNAKSLILILEDPDAPGGIFSHWLLWNLDSSTKEIREDSKINVAMEGRNSFGRVGYSGPCPPPGQTHRYIFRLLATDKRLLLSTTSGREILDQEIKNHILTQTSLTSTFSR